MADDSNIIALIRERFAAVEKNAEERATAVSDRFDGLHGEVVEVKGEIVEVKTNVNGRLTGIERKQAEAEAVQRALEQRQQAQEQRDEKVEKLEREQERERTSRRRYVVSGVLILLGAAIASLVGSLAPSLIH